METKVLLIGESWVSASTHLKGFDFFSSAYYATGGDFLIAALASAGVQVTHQPSHEAAKSFPFQLNKLQEHDVVILSDIGANIEDGIRECRAIGPIIGLPFFLSRKAEALHLAGRTSEALEAINEAEAFVERTEARWWCIELHRLRGVFLTAIGAAESEIEASFCAAIRAA